MNNTQDVLVGIFLAIAPAILAGLLSVFLESIPALEWLGPIFLYAAGIYGAFILAFLFLSDDMKGRKYHHTGDDKNE